MRLLLVALVLALVIPAVARADGDPASDILLGENIYVDLPYPYPPVVRQLQTVLAGARKQHRPLKVAIIATIDDLGAIAGLWRKPEQYARFLAAELQFVYKGQLLIVMPNGFGLADTRRKSVRQVPATLKDIPIGKGLARLSKGALAAARRLAPAPAFPTRALRTVAPAALPVATGSHSRNWWLIGAALGSAGLVLLALLRRLAQAHRP